VSRIIPNENSWIAFATAVAAISAPTVAELTAAIDLTDYIVTINASTTGNTVPTPSLKSLFETSVPGTAAAQFTADMYRDDESDLAWLTLPRNTRGFFLISRFGGTGPAARPVATQLIEVWPVHVSSRAGGALSSNTAQTFTVTCSVPDEPDEDAVVAA
jgi:hypothetical protein